MFRIFSIVILLILIGSIGVGFYQFDKVFNTELTIKEEGFLEVSSGSSLSSFANQLVQKKWITTPLWLKAYGRVFPEQVNIKAGTYLIKTKTTLAQLIATLVKGQEYQFSITFIEGTRFQDALDQLEKHPYIQHTLQSTNISAIAGSLGVKQLNPEGWIFPDTYAFTAGTPDLKILERAYSNMRKKLSELWLQRSDELPYKSAYEALIMASIIEKETSFVAEQGVISSVFVNRLNKRMRLQTDPTVIYGLGDRYKGDITRAHLREKTLYNTYKINGLPPTPIALPGLSALKATLHPAKSDYLYFVSGGDGTHVFSKTLVEHNLAVQRYLKIQKQKNN